MASSFWGGLFEKTDRPRIKPESTQIDIALEVAAAMALAALVIVPLAMFGSLPERIPSHVNIRGEVDGWSGRWSIFLLPAISVAVYALLTVVNKHPHTFNFPWKITPQNAERQYRLAMRMLRVLKLLVMAIFFVVNLQLLSLAEGGGVDWWLTPLLVGVMSGTILIYFIVASRDI